MHISVRALDIEPNSIFGKVFDLESWSGSRDFIYARKTCIDLVEQQFGRDEKKYFSIRPIKSTHLVMRYFGQKVEAFLSYSLRIIESHNWALKGKVR